jgi:multidrug efflux system membrane fusion protein
MRAQTWQPISDLGFQISDHKSTIAALLIFTITLVSCGRDDAFDRPPIPVSVQPVKEHSGASGVRYSASIVPHIQVNLAFKVSGYIREILQVQGADGRMRYVQEGDIVSAGEVLAWVTETDYIDKVKQAKAQLAEALASLQKGTDAFNRAKFLYSTQSITQPDYDTARKEYEVSLAQVAGARAQLDTAELNLKYCSLTAPMDGVLIKRNIEVGSLVEQSFVGFVLADMSSVKVVFGVPDVMLKNVKLGNKLAITTESIRNTVFHGIITAISPAANPQSRIFNVEVTVQNPQNLLKINMIASLVLADKTLTQSSMVVPLSAIVASKEDPNGYAVFVAEEEKGRLVARVRNVQLGEVYGDMVGVTEGIKVGEKVIVIGATRVVDGEPVKIIP